MPLYDLTAKAGLWVGGQRIQPGQTQIFLTTTQAFYELQNGTIVLAGMQPPAPPAPPVVNDADQLIMRRVSDTRLVNAGSFRAWVLDGVVGASWASLPGKPATFPASAHQHSAADIVSGTLDPARIPANISVAWANLQNVPASFPPAAHNHAIGEVNGLNTALNAKAAEQHSHAMADITGLQEALDAKAPAFIDIVFQNGNYAAPASDHGKLIGMDSATALTLTLPANAPIKTEISLFQAGDGQVTIAAAAGATRLQRQNFSKTAGKGSVVSAIVIQNVGGNAAVWLVSGDMVA